MLRQQRLLKELHKIERAPPEGISITSKNDSYSSIEAKIIGPEETPYEKGIFKLDISVPEKYPFIPPSIKFVTKVYHPNIDENGRICMDLIKMPPGGSWKPTFGLEGLLIAVRMLLANPNIEDPLMPDIAKQFQTSFEEYRETALAWTEKYALI